MDQKPLGTLISELRALILTYVRQEVTGPLRGATRFVKLGLIGGLIAVPAGVLVSLGLLRLFQTVTLLDIDNGGWSWLVYLVVSLICLAIGGYCVIKGVRSPRGGSVGDEPNR